MYLVTDNLPGNVHESASLINKLHLARFVLSIDYTGGNYSVVVFRADSYPDYVLLCKRLCKTPVSTKEFFE